MDLILDCLTDTLVDTLKLLPFLFLTYLAMEAIERRLETAQDSLLRRRGKNVLGPIAGALLGAIPQCGFSASSASLYSGGLISIGTLLAVFLSTSDEMLPLLISSKSSVLTMVCIVASKAAVGLITGLCVDFAVKRFWKIRRKKGLPSPDENAPLQLSPKHIHDLCEDEHCGCEEEEGGILRSALKHTLHIVIFVLIITFALNLAVSFLGEDELQTVLAGHPIAGIFLSSAVGLIPNCASSILITQLYLDGLITVGQMMAGLLVGSGVGLLVLFRTNRRHIKESAIITVMLYLSGVIWGLLITAVLALI